MTVVLTDIEGTTSSIDFVHQVLFPYARDHLAEFVASHAADPAVRAQLQATAELAGEPAADDARLVAILIEWIEADRKATPLKALQGMIWKTGFTSGAFQAHMYPDAVAALRQWRAGGMRQYVYSSGSIAAQRLYFAHTEAGDLSDLFDGHFDTTTGPKREADSYRRIVSELTCPASQVWFLSDVAAELDAAAAAGLHTVWVVRDASVSLAQAGHQAVRSFDQIGLLGP